MGFYAVRAMLLVNWPLSALIGRTLVPIGYLICLRPYLHVLHTQVDRIS
jgi:hypothetical protein